MKSTVLILICALYFVFCIFMCCHADSPRYIRVAIIQNTESFSLRIRGGYKIVDSLKGGVLYSARNLRTVVTAYSNGILIGGMVFNKDRIFINADDADAIVVNGRRFRGSMQFIKNNNSRILVVNRIELEDYIKGILYHEVSHYWPMEALKAQAIACRTYALYQIQQNKDKDFDVTSDIYSQVYGGKTSERYRTSKAVKDSLSQVLYYEGKIFPAYYHATCAGHTENASLLWNINIAPLRGVVCGFCKESPHFNWHYVSSIDEIKNKLQDAGYKIIGIKDIVVLGKDKSGRITDLQLVDTKDNIKIPAKDLRNIIGPNIIRSTNFNVSIIKEDVIFEGIGWGHGVGLCQWGAYFMAKQDYTTKQILEYYYPDAEVSQ